LRIISGLSAGGECAGIQTYITEMGGEDRDHTLVAAIGLNNVSGSLAFFVANLVAGAVLMLPEDDQLRYGWRIPFLLAGPVGIASAALRRRMPETEVYQQLASDRQTRERMSSSPTSELSMLGSTSSSYECDSVAGPMPEEEHSSMFANVRAVALAIIVIVPINSCNYIAMFLAAWLKKSVGFSSTMALSISALNKFVQLVMTFPVSFFADRYGGTKVMLVGGILTSVLTLPAMLAVEHSAEILPDHQPGVAFAVALQILGVVLAMAVSIYLVPSNLYLTSLFPAHLRGRGVGVGLGLVSCAGGSMPMVAAALAKKAVWLPGLYVATLAIPSLLAIMWTRRAAGRGVLTVHQRAWLF